MIVRTIGLHFYTIHVDLIGDPKVHNGSGYHYKNSEEFVLYNKVNKLKN